MRLSPRLLLTLLLLTGMTSCAVKKGGKRHKKPSGGSGKGCDCPSFGQVEMDDAILLDQFQEEKA